MLMDVFYQGRNGAPQIGAWEYLDTVNVPDNESMSPILKARYAWDYAILEACKRKEMDFERYWFIARVKLDKASFV